MKFLSTSSYIWLSR